MAEPWLGHENGCEIQWSTWCTCGPEDVDLSETPPEQPWETTLAPDELEG